MPLAGFAMAVESDMSKTFNAAFGELKARGEGLGKPRGSYCQISESRRGALATRGQATRAPGITFPEQDENV